MVTSALASTQDAGLGRRSGFLDEEGVGTAEERSQPLRLTSVSAGVGPTPGASDYLRICYHQLPGVQFSTSWDNQKFGEILTWEEKDRGPNGRPFAVQF